MSLATALRSLATSRNPAAVRRAFLDLDAGEQLTPTVYPYPPGLRPVRPFAGRILHPGQGERPRAQLYPPTRNPTQRAFAHVDDASRTAALRNTRGDVSGNARPANILRTRPYLFAGGSSATTADKLAAAGTSPGSAGAGGCEGCE